MSGHIGEHQGARPGEPMIGTRGVDVHATFENDRGGAPSFGGIDRRALTGFGRAWNGERREDEAQRREAPGRGSSHRGSAPRERATRRVGLADTTWPGTRPRAGGYLTPVPRISIESMYQPPYCTDPLLPNTKRTCSESLPT